MKTMQRYIYNGPVMEFGKLIAYNWRAETVAMSERKAKSNLTYQFKQETGRLQTTKIDLPGKVELVKEGIAV